MDFVHLQGITLIQYLQETFKPHSELMLWASHLGDPRNAFLIYFPLMFFLLPTVGKRILWIAALSEWMNGILKWILHGERPYWWVHETLLYQGETTPVLNQYRLTCETGPGSPSGHVMVTSAVLFEMTSAFIQYVVPKSALRTPISICLWCLYLMLLLVVGISRCFIATHFPHQIIAGIIVGTVVHNRSWEGGFPVRPGFSPAIIICILLAVICRNISTSSLTFRDHCLCSAISLVVAVGTYFIIQKLGLDPLWSVAKAQKWCAQPKWVHLDTTLFYILVRDAASILGLGIALKIYPKSPGKQSYPCRLCCLVLSLITTQLTEIYKIPQIPVGIFYFLSFLKCAMLIVVIVLVIPKFCNIFFKNNVSKKIHNS